MLTSDRATHGLDASVPWRLVVLRVVDESGSEAGSRGKIWPEFFQEVLQVDLEPM